MVVPPQTLMLIGHQKAVDIVGTMSTPTINISMRANSRVADEVGGGHADYGTAQCRHFAVRQFLQMIVKATAFADVERTCTTCCVEEHGATNSKSSGFR